MKRLVFLLLSTTITAASAADKSDPLSCLDPIVAATFLTGFGTQGMPSVSQNVPEPLSGVEQLENINFIGTYESGTNYSAGKNLGFVSDKPVAEVEQVLEQFLRSHGWDQSRNDGSRGTGFRQATRSQGITLCSDADGMVTLMVREFDGQTVANLMSYSSRNVDCASMNSRMAYRPIGLNKHMPTLDLPDGAKLSMNVGMGNSSSGNAASTQAGFQVDRSKTQVLAHFDQQIEAQGWSLDSGWEGQQVSGSSWTKTMDDKSVVGILTLVANDDSFAVRFEIQALP